MPTSSTPEQNEPSERRVEDAPQALLDALDKLNPTPRGFAAMKKSPFQYTNLQGPGFDANGLYVGA